MEARQGRGRSSGQEMSQRSDKADPSRLKSDLGASFLRAARSGNYELVMEFLNDARVNINASNANGLNALHLAAKDGHVRIVTELLNHGIDIDSATKKGNTALHIASLAGHLDVVKVLVQHRAKINSQAQDGFTPLYMAAQENHADVVKYLLDKGANVNLATEEGFTPLAVALQQDHTQVVKILTEASQKGRVKLSALHVAAKKDDVRAALMLLENEQNQRDRLKPSEIINEPTKSGFTPLHIAAHYGNQNIAGVLIDHGAEVDFRARNSITPLHVATKWGRKNIVSLLLNNFASVDCKTKDGLTPLHCAARSGHDLVVNMLLEGRAPVSAKTRNGLTALHMAAQGDHVDCARILISHKASVDEVTVDYLTPLHVAAHCGNVATAKLLLDRNCEVNARALNGFTPLHIACKKNRIKVIELLLQYGASIVSTTESGLTPLHVASFMGYLEIVEMLLERKCDPNAPTVRGETPLHLATRGNQVDVMRLLLKRGAQVDAKAKEDQTPLHTAARTGSVDAILVLLQHKAAPNAPTKELYTPLHIAAKEGHEEVIQVLLDNGADIGLKTSKGFSPLHIAAKYGNVNAARILMSNGSDQNGVGKNGLTPLHVATHYNQVEVAQLLLDKGSKPQAAAKNGYTPLHIAAKKNEIEIATALLDHGAKPNAESRNGFIPVHLAAQEGYAEMVQLLLRRGTNQNSRAKNGLTPMHLAAQEDHVPVAEVLVKHRAEIDPQTKAGYTPLHAACHFGQLNMIRFLLDNGASVHSTTKAGHTPLHQAAQQGHVLVINMLLRCRADPNALTATGQTPLSIAQCLGYISVVEILKEITEVSVTEVDDSYRYKPMAPEVMQEAAMSDEDEDDEADEKHLADQSYQFLTTGDDIGGLHEEHGEEIGIVQGKLMQEPPLDLEHQVVTVEEVVKDTERKYDLLAAPPDVPLYRSNLSETDSRMFGSTYSGMSYASSLDPDNVALHRQPIFSGFLVSFLVDARGGAMRGCRHSGIRIIIPPGRACMPTRVTCKLVKKEKLPQVPPLMEGEALASRVLVMGPSGAKFLGPVILEVPHFASLRGTEREITVLRSENGLTWKEHTDLATLDSMQNTLCGSFEDLESAEELYNRRITRIITSDFPKYFAIVTRIRQETSMLTQKGGVVSSIIIPQVKTVFPPGAVTKNIKLGLQAHPISDELVLKNTGNKLSVSPVVTIEPRRRKFHLPITVTIPLPPNLQTAKPVDKIPTLRLLCSMNAAMDPTEWEDITGSTPLTLANNCASFTTTVSARFWLINAASPKESLPIAARLYTEALVVPFMANFVIFAKRLDVLDAQLRLFCMTDDKMDKTLETQEKYTEISRSREVEVLDGKPQWIECVGNLLPVIKSDKSDKQPRINFRAFRENRQSLNVRIRDVDHEPSGNLLFMREARSMKEQIPICNLTVTLPSGVGDEPAGHTVDSVELQEKLKALKQIEIPEDEVFSKAELRLTDIAECLDEDWIPLAKQLGLTSEEITKVEKDYSYVTEQALVMLHLWIEKNKDAASGNALERSLRAIKREDIITKCICSVEEVTDVKEKQVAKTYFNSGDRDRPSPDLDLDHGQQNGLLESPTEAPYVARQVSKNRQTVGGRENLVNDEVLSFVKQQAMSVLANRLAQEQQQQQHQLLQQEQQQDRLHPSTDAEVEPLIPDDVSKDQHLSIATTKTPPSTPADMESMHSPTDITESEIVASFAKKDKRHLENEDDEPILTDGEEVHLIQISKEPHVPNIEQEDTGAEEIIQTSSEAVPVANGSTADSTSWPGVEETSFEDWVERKEMGRSDPSKRATLIHENSKELVAGEVRTQTINGELDLRIEIDEDEVVTDDGTLIRRQVITRRHVCPVTEITMVGGVESDRRNTDRLVKVEVEEDILELPPGVDESADQENLATRTSVSESDETLPDGVPLHRRVTRTTIVPGVSGEIENRAGKMVDDAFGEALDEMRAGTVGETDASDHGDDVDAAVLRVYTDTKEGVPEVETDVQEFEEILDDGTVIRRRVIKTKQKQTITKRVVVEGPEDELPENEEEAQEMLRRVEAGEPSPTGVESRRDGAKPETSVQEYEETLPDGTVMKRRIITTTEQQLTTERVILEADDGDDDTGDEHIPNSEGGVDGTDMQVVKPDSDDEETAVVMLKKEIRRKKILRDGKEEMIITEDVRLVQDEEEPEELRDSVQTIIDQFMEGSSYDVDSSFGQPHK